MNKILMDGELFILSDNITNITVNGTSTIYINNLEKMDLTIDLGEKSNLIILDYNDIGGNSKIVVNHKDSSNFNYIHSFKIKNEYSLKYLANFNGNKCEDNIYIKGISNGMVNIDLDGKVLDNTKDNVLDENVKVIVDNGKANIKPMMHISCMEVMANHNTAISNFSEDELLYLMSKGIDRESSIKLIEDGILFGQFKEYEDFINLIKK